MYNCPVCTNGSFKNLHALWTGLIAAKTATFTCPVCPTTCFTLEKLAMHLFNHIHSDSTPPTESFKCYICGCHFVKSDILQMHVDLVHGTHTPDTFNCHLCQKKFRMKGSLMIHVRMVHCGRSIAQIFPAKERVDEPPAKVIYKKQWQCDVCQKLFTTKYFLKKHKRLHTGETPYECKLCGKAFTFQQSYHKHLQYHNTDKPHGCVDCGRAFKELSTLHNHQRIHSGERPFECDTCGKRFRQRVSYLVHSRIHTGEMPYTCVDCGKKFRYKVSQRTHKCTKPKPNETHSESDDNPTNGVIPEPDYPQLANIDFFSLVESPSPTSRLQNLQLHNDDDRNQFAFIDDLCSPTATGKDAWNNDILDL